MVCIRQTLEITNKNGNLLVSKQTQKFRSEIPVIQIQQRSFSYIWYTMFPIIILSTKDTNAATNEYNSPMASRIYITYWSDYWSSRNVRQF